VQRERFCRRAKVLYLRVTLIKANLTAEYFAVLPFVFDKECLVILR